MKAQFHFLLLSVLLGLLPANVSNASDMNALVDPALACVDARWRTASFPDLLKAAESGNAQAQYACWIREFERSTQEMNSLERKSQSYFYSLSPQDQRKYAEDENRLKSKWEAASDAELEAAAVSGDQMALHFLANRKADQAAGNMRKAFAWLEGSAEQGFAPAALEASMYYLGQRGWGIVEVDQAKGLKLLRDAAEHGLSAAQYQLAQACRAGQWLPPDLEKAVHYFQLAADQGGTRSQYELAMLYANGNGIPRSSADTAVALLTKSARSGYSQAAYALAERYRAGIGVSRDCIKAIRYYEAARNNDNNAPSTARNADIFQVLDDNLQPQAVLEPDFVDFALVASAYLKAERGDAASMAQIGDWYQSGQFMRKDNIEAFRWYNLAANFGMINAAKKRDAVKTTLTPQELAEALKPLNESQ